MHLNLRELRVSTFLRTLGRWGDLRVRMEVQPLAGVPDCSSGAAKSG